MNERDSVVIGIVGKSKLLDFPTMPTAAKSHPFFPTLLYKSKKILAGKTIFL